MGKYLKKEKDVVPVIFTSVDPSADVQSFVKNHFGLAGLIHGAGDNRNSPLLVAMDLHMVKLRLTHWQIDISVLSKNKTPKIPINVETALPKTNSHIP